MAIQTVWRRKQRIAEAEGVDRRQQCSIVPKQRKTKGNKRKRRAVKQKNSAAKKTSHNIFSTNESKACKTESIRLAVRPKLVSMEDFDTKNIHQRTTLRAKNKRSHKPKRSRSSRCSGNIAVGMRWLPRSVRNRLVRHMNAAAAVEWASKRRRAVEAANKLRNRRRLGLPLRPSTVCGFGNKADSDSDSSRQLERRRGPKLRNRYYSRGNRQNRPRTGSSSRARDESPTLSSYRIMPSLPSPSEPVYREARRCGHSEKKNHKVLRERHHQWFNGVAAVDSGCGSDEDVDQLLTAVEEAEEFMSTPMDPRKLMFSSSSGVRSDSSLSSSGDGEDEWECKCFFMNTNQAKKCALCEEPRPQEMGSEALFHSSGSENECYSAYFDSDTSH